MKRAVSILSLLLVCATLNAQFASAELVSARSMSGQFVVRAPAIPSGFLTTGPKVDEKETLTFNPPRLVISCERIKQVVYETLGVSGGWRGLISIKLHPMRTADDPIVIACNRFNDGWNYQLEMSPTVRKQRFMRAIVQTILLELANRNAGKRSSEIPEWLIEGLTQQLLASNQAELLPPSPSKSINGILVTRTVIDQRRRDPLEESRQILKTHTQLTLEQLSWPTDAQLLGNDGGVYRASAQLFTSELLRLKDGPDCMRKMIFQLAGCYNWQTAFLRSFNAYFARPLDVEKWWALQTVIFTGRDPTRLWTIDESWRKLDETLQIPAEVRRKATELPASTDITLQSVINEWDYTRQKKMINDKVRILDFLRLRLAPDVAALAVEYQETLSSYLNQRKNSVFTLPMSKSAPSIRNITRETVKQLDALDEKRATLKSSLKLAGVARN